MLAFLCGAMEYAEDEGRAWRWQMKNWLHANLNHQAYDPTEEAHRILIPEEIDHLSEWKGSDPVRFRKLMRRIIRHDLDVMTRRADYVICLWDRAAARGAGTQAELTFAFRKGLPVYLISSFPPDEISGWLLGCVDRVFSDFTKLKEYLQAAYGRVPRPEASLRTVGSRK